MRLKFDDPMVIAMILLIFVPSVLLWGMYGCYPYHYPPWPVAPQEILDNILTNTLFLGISLFIAAVLIQRVEFQRSKTANNALCHALARLVVFADMRIANGDTKNPFPTLEDRNLSRLYHFGGTANATREMDATVSHYQSMVVSDNFMNSVFENHLDLAPRIHKYIKDTEGIRQDLRTVLISRVITMDDNENIIKHLGRYENLYTDFEGKINDYANEEDFLAAAYEINNFLVHTWEAYHVLKGGRWLHPIGALYGPEDPPELSV